MASTNYWAVDLSQSTIFAYSKIQRAFVTVPVTAVPEIYALCVHLASQTHELPDSDKLLGPYYQRKGCNYCYKLPLAPAALVDVLTLKDGSKTSFHKSKVSGEICMSDYTVHTIESVRPAYRWPGTLAGTKIYDAGWSMLSDPHGVGNIAFSQSTLDAWDVSASLNKVSFLYRFYVQDGTNFSFAPPVSLNPFAKLVTSEPIQVSVVTSAIASANNGYWDALTEFGELHETIAFVRDSLKRLLSMSLHLHNQLRSGIRTLRVYDDLPKRFGKEAREAWLQYRYALSPLAYSVSDIKEVLKAWLDRIYRTEWANKAIRVSVPTIDGMTPSVTEIDTYHKCTIKDRYDASTFATKLNALLTINPFVTAYELTRLSFVLDWFVNVGDFIAARTAVVLYSDRKVCYSRKLPNTVITYSPTAGNGPIVYVTVTAYKREVINPSDHVGLTSDVYLNWKRLADAAALGIPPILKLLRSLK